MKIFFEPRSNPMESLIWLFCWSTIFLLFFVFSWHSWYGADIWYHMYLGRAVLQQHLPNPADNLILKQENFKNIYWIFQLMVYGIYRIGDVAGVTAFFSIIWGTIFALGIKVSGIKRFPHLGLPVALAAVLIFQTRFEERPEVFSYFFVMLYLYWIYKMEEDGRLSNVKKAVWTAAQVLWVNMHGYFFVGPCILALWIIVSYIGSDRGKKAGLRKESWILLVLLIAATFASPFGTGGWATAFEYAKYAGGMKYRVEEFKPISFDRPLDMTEKLILGWDLAFIALIALTIIKERHFFYPAVCLVGICLSLFATRNGPLTVAMSFPLLGLFLARHGVRIAANRLISITSLIVAIALSLACLAYSIRVIRTGSYIPYMTYTSFGNDLSRKDHAFGPLEYFEKTGFKGSVFNHPSDGSFLEFHMPELRLYSDSRFIDLKKTQDYFEALDNPEKFSVIYNTTPFDAILINAAEGQRDLLKLLSMPDFWEIAYVDPYRCLLVNRLTPAGKKAPFGGVSVFEGQDLTQPENAALAKFWLELFSYFQKRNYLITALKQYSKAGILPPSLIKVAMDYGLATADGEVIALADKLSPQMMKHPPIKGIKPPH